MRCATHCPKGAGLVLPIAGVATTLAIGYWVVSTLFMALVLAGAASFVALAGAAALTIRHDAKGALPLAEFNARRALPAVPERGQLMAPVRPAIEASPIPVTITVINELGQEV